MGYVLYVQLYMPLELPIFIDHGRWAVARDFLMKTTYWPQSLSCVRLSRDGDIMCERNHPLGCFSTLSGSSKRKVALREGPIESKSKQRQPS